MRIHSMTAVLGLAIVLGGVLAESAYSANKPGGGGGPGAGGPSQMSANPRGGGGGGGGDRGDRDIGRDDPGAGNAESMSRFRECPNGGVVGIDCPAKKKNPIVQKPKDEDCQCKPIAMSIGGKTQIVLDCYQTKLYNDIKRTYVCTRPE